MTKQFGLKQLFRKRAAVNGNKGIFAARAGVVDRLRRDLFPVPLWPLISTLTSDWAIIRACSSRRSMIGLRVTMDSRHASSPEGCRVLQRAVDGFVECVFIYRLGEEAEYALLGCGDGIRN